MVLSKKQIAARYYQKHKEKIKAKRRQYYQDHWFVELARSKQRYYDTNQQLTRLGTLAVVKRSDDFEVELRHVRWMKRRWLKKRKPQHEQTLRGNQIIEDMNVPELFDEGLWYWDRKVWDYVTDDVFTFLYHNKPN